MELQQTIDKSGYPNMNHSVTPAPSNNGLNLRYKTQLCRHFENLGKCQVGDKCQFAHGQQELRNQNQPLTEGQMQNAIRAQQNASMNQQQRQNLNNNQGNRQQNFNQGANSQGQSGSNYKTVKCKFFESQRGCPYKERCSFAHGDQELRANPGMQSQQYHHQQFNNHLPMPMAPQMHMYQNQMPNMMINPQAQSQAQAQAFMDPQQQQMLMMAANPNMMMGMIDPNQLAFMQSQGMLPPQYQAMMMMQQQQQPVSPDQMNASGLKIQGTAAPMIDPSQQQQPTVAQLQQMAAANAQLLQQTPQDQQQLQDQSNMVNNEAANQDPSAQF